MGGGNPVRPAFPASSARRVTDNRVSPTADAEQTVAFQAIFRGIFTSAIVLGHRVEGEPASCTCPLHGTEFVRWVQSSVNQVLEYGFRCGMGSEWIFRG